MTVAICTSLTTYIFKLLVLFLLFYNIFTFRGFNNMLMYNNNNNYYYYYYYYKFYPCVNSFVKEIIVVNITIITH